MTECHVMAALRGCFGAETRLEFEPLAKRIGWSGQRLPIPI